MDTLQLLQDGAGAAAVLYATTITMATITAIASPDPAQRRDARLVLAILIGQGKAPRP